MADYSKILDEISNKKAELEAWQFRTLEKAMKSDSPADMVKASKVLDTIQKKTEDQAKSFLIDPLEFNSNLGYKDKAFSLTYTTLNRMSKTPIINSIIKTRKIAIQIQKFVLINLMQGIQIVDVLVIYHIQMTDEKVWN